ncbi:MAG: hypothetical protein RL417_1249 [Pseudomonadota bacterium]|jgi:hypothetical protein
MKKIFLCLCPLAILIEIWSTAAPAAAAAPGCELVTEGLAAAQAIRGLRAKQAIPCLVHDQAQVKAHLSALIETKIPREKLAAEERLFKSIGLLSADFQYKEGLIDLYVSQLGGYYDPEKKHFVMAGWMPEFVQKPIIVHELTHALQDHYFDLERLLDHGKESSDVLLARSALAEGDATAVMIDHTRQQMGQPSLRSERGVDLIIAQNVIGMAMMPGLEKVPEALKAMLIFPYTSGLRFAHALLQRDGYRSLDEAFRAPPRSTEEVLHPELYGRKRADFTEVDDSSALKFGPAGSVVEYGDTIGEFLLAAALGSLSGDKIAATKAAAGWGGDRATLLVNTAAGTRTLVWQLRWDSPEDAAEFRQLYNVIRRSDRVLERQTELAAPTAAREVVVVRSLGDERAR